MAAPALTIAEQKNALSGKKKQKKTIKNILGLPNNIKIEFQVLQDQEAKNLKKILERFLPEAKIPFQEKRNFHNTKEKLDLTPEQVELMQQAKNKRNNLSLGVNELSRNVKKNLVSCALLASDIQPKFLVNHINLLCNHNNVPLLHMPDLRQITLETLGFPCICLGFKKNCDFSEVVHEIKSIAESKRSKKTGESSESSSESNQYSEEEENNALKVSDEESENDTKPFEYLYRIPTEAGVFVPDTSINDISKQQNPEFLALEKDENDIKTSNDEMGISSNLVRKNNKKKKPSYLENLESMDMDDEKDFKILRKKSKKSWVIDTVGTKQKFKYSPANVYKVHKNYNRHNSKNK